MIALVLETGRRRAIFIARVCVDAFASFTTIVTHLQIGLNDLAWNIRVLLGENGPQSISAAMVHFFMGVIDNVVHFLDGDEESNVFVLIICPCRHQSLFALNINDVEAFDASIIFRCSVARLFLLGLDRFAENLFQTILRVDTASCRYGLDKHIPFACHD